MEPPAFLHSLPPGAEPPSFRYRFDLGNVLSRAFSISWRHKWLWVLGVFGSSGAGFNGSGGNGGGGGGSGGRSDQFGHFIEQYLVLILAAVLLLVLIGLIAFVISCIAVPGSIWAGLQLDAGREVRLGRAWREGRARGWRYFRLVLIQFLIGLAAILVIVLFVLIGVLLFAVGREAVVPLLVLGGIGLFLALLVAFVLLGLGLLWAPRLLVILDLGAVDSIRASWWLFMRSKGDTFVFALAFGVIKFAIGLGVLLGVAVISIPWIVMVIVFFATHDAALILLVLGVLWLVIVGGGALIISSGYLGALDQVGYALAARDLALSRGMEVRPEAVGFDPYAPPPPMPPAGAPAT